MGRRPKETRRDSFGAWLHFLRKQSGLSQEEVQIALETLLQTKIGNSTMSQWERKGNLGGKDTIPALANVLGVTLEELLRVKRTNDGKYVPLLNDPEDDERLQLIGQKKSPMWNPGKNVPEGYTAQLRHNRKRNVSTVFPNVVKVKIAVKGDTTAQRVTEPVTAEP